MRRLDVARVSAALGVILFVSAASVAAAGPRAGWSQVTSAVQAEIVWTPTPGPGKKCPINDDYFFKYEFNEKPKMGMVILKIQVFDKKGNQVVPYLIIGRSDMPSMRGAHDSGEVEFKLNKRNDYLLPVNIVMPGEWEIRVTMKLNGQPVYYGSIRFDV
jgi:hypothetical protein